MIVGRLVGQSTSLVCQLLGGVFSGARKICDCAGRLVGQSTFLLVLRLWGEVGRGGAGHGCDCVGNLLAAGVRQGGVFCAVPNLLSDKNKSEKTPSP